MPLSPRQTWHISSIFLALYSRNPAQYPWKIRTLLPPPPQHASNVAYPRLHLLVLIKLRSHEDLVLICEHNRPGLGAAWLVSADICSEISLMSQLMNMNAIVQWDRGVSSEVLYTEARHQLGVSEYSFRTSVYPSVSIADVYWNTYCLPSRSRHCNCLI